MMQEQQNGQYMRGAFAFYISSMDAAERSQTRKLIADQKAAADGDQLEMLRAILFERWCNILWKDTEIPT